MILTKISLFFLICLFGLYSKTAKSQYCGCSPILCCSQYGYCGSSYEYCGAGCQSGPCKTSKEMPVVDMIVTQSFFDRIMNQTGNSCAGRRFYTRDSFINAAKTFSTFANSVTRREIASMFAHFTYETEHFFYIEEVNGTSLDYCDENNSQYPCAPGKSYYGRGPFQLSWNYNYGACGQSLGLDLLREPELVTTNSIIAFRAALWFWMKSLRPVLNQGFGATIRAINGMECNGRNPSAVNARIKYYRDYCGQFGVDAGANTTC